jgi:hypothetical protein
MFDASGRFRDIVQGEKFRARARRDSVSATLLVAEFHQRSSGVELLNDGADLPSCKSLRRKIRQQCHYVQDGRSIVLCAGCRIHHNTQQVTKVGQLSPVRTIQIVLTTARLSCRLIVASRRQ